MQWLKIIIINSFSSPAPSRPLHSTLYYNCCVYLEAQSHFLEKEKKINKSRGRGGGLFENEPISSKKICLHYCIERERLLLGPLSGISLLEMCVWRDEQKVLTTKSEHCWRGLLFPVWNGHVNTHTACKLSAVKLFQRISLAWRFSVSSNNVTSNSTLGSLVTGVLAGEKKNVNDKSGTEHGVEHAVSITKMVLSEINFEINPPKLTCRLRWTVHTLTRGRFGQ